METGSRLEADTSPGPGPKPAPAEPAGTVDAQQGRHRWIAAGSVIVLVAAALVALGRAPTPGLHELQPVGWGNADGRDAARTGRVDVEPIREPGDEPRWERRFGRGARQADVWPELHGSLVLLRQQTSTAVLDRTTGRQLLDLGPRVDVVGGLIVSHGSNGEATVFDRAGRPRWTARTDQLLDVDGALFSLVDEPQPQLQRLDWVDGSVQWSVTAAPDTHHLALVDAVDGTILVLEAADAGQGPFGVRHLVVDAATGAHHPVVLPHDPQAAGQPVLLDGSTAVVLQGGQAVAHDLATGDRIRMIPQLDGSYLAAWGAFLKVADGDGEVLHERPTLTELVRIEDGWFDLWVSQRHGGDAVAYTVLDPEGGVAEVRWFDATGGRTLEVLTVDPEALSAWDVDPSGTIEVVDRTVVARRPDGTVTWAVDVDERSGVLAVVDGTVVAALDARAVAIGDDERLVTYSADADAAAEVTVNRASVGAAGIVPAGDQFVHLAGRVVQGHRDPSGQERTWRIELAAAATAAVGGDGVVWIAAGGQLVEIDALTGQQRVVAEVPAVHALSAAGPSALVAVADPVCMAGVRPPADATCIPGAHRLDATTGEVAWSADVAGACAGATLAEGLVAVPTWDGLAFLDQADGREVGRWSGLERTSCTGAAWSSGRWILPADGGLVAGSADRIDIEILLDEPAVTAPVIVGGTQVLVGTADALTAVDLRDGTIVWARELGSGLAAPPLVVDTRLYVLTIDSEVIRLR